MARSAKLPKVLYGVVDPDSREVITFHTKKERKDWIADDLQWNNGNDADAYRTAEYALIEE